jgi:hypothetical protein
VVPAEAAEEASKADAADSAAREADLALAAAVEWVVLVEADSAAALGAWAVERVAWVREPPADVVVLVVLVQEPLTDVVVMPDLVAEQPLVLDPFRTATSSAGFLACPQTRGYRMPIPLA